MKRPFQVPLFVLAAALGASGALAAESSPILQDPALAAKSADTPAAPHAISPEIAGRITAALPKYTPAPAAKSVEPGADLRETDKPRNGIIRLPSYVVQEEKEPVFKERELLTPKGRLDLALRRHPGLRIGNLWGLNNGWALAMLEEEERIERQREFHDLVTLLPVADGKKAKALADDVFVRTDFTPTR